MKKLILRTLVGLLASIALLSGLTTPASADPITPAASVSAVQLPAKSSYSEPSVCAYNGSKYAQRSDLLPVKRWMEATSQFHSRLDNTFFSDTNKLMQRHVAIGGAMRTGNFMWSLGTDMSSMAINFCILDTAGGTIDRMAGAIGKMVTTTVLGGMLMLGVLVMILLKARKTGRFDGRQLVMKIAVMALLSIMVAGAMKSSGGGINGSTAAYKPGIGSPGWVIGTVNKTIGSLATAPAAVLGNAIPLDVDSSNGTGNRLSCSKYVEKMRDGYKQQYGKGAMQLNSGVPLMLSNMWESTGLHTWQQAQFGTTGLESNAWCHLLEWNAGTPIQAGSWDNDKLPNSSTVRAIMTKLIGVQTKDQDKWESKAFKPTSDTDRDRSIIAWAACKPKNAGSLKSADSWTIQPGFAIAKDAPKPEDCANWWTGNKDNKAFDWPTDESGVVKRATGGSGSAVQQADLGTFVRTLHGEDNSAGGIGAMAFALSAFLMLFVFGAMSIAIIGAKIAMALMMLGIMLTLIMLLIVERGGEKLGKTAKQLVGISVFVFGIQLIFGIVAAISKLLQVAGSLVGAPGTVLNTIWTGLSPVIAVILLHLVFKKLLKMPSPFTIAGGMAWGSQAASGFGAVTDKVNGMGSRMMNGAGRRFGSGAKMVGSNALSYASGGRMGSRGGKRAGSASPMGANTLRAKGNQRIAEMAAQGPPSHGKGAPKATDGTAPALGSENATTADPSATEATPAGQPLIVQGGGATTAATSGPATTAAGTATAIGAAGVAGAAAGTVAAGMPRVTGRADGALRAGIADSTVANSRLTENGVNPHERRDLRRAAREERADAFAWQQENTPKQRAGMRGIARGVASKKGLAVAGLGIVAATALPAIPAAAAVAGGLYAAKKAGRFLDRHDRVKNDQRVDAYREAMKSNQRATVAQERAARNGKAKVNDPARTRPNSAGPVSQRDGESKIIKDSVDNLDPSKNQAPRSGGGETVAADGTTMRLDVTQDDGTQQQQRQDKVVPEAAEKSKAPVQGPAQGQPAPEAKLPAQEKPAPQPKPAQEQQREKVTVGAPLQEKAATQPATAPHQAPRRQSEAKVIPLEKQAPRPKANPEAMGGQAVSESVGRSGPRDGFAG